jgi:hypothetical protein
MAHRGTHCVNEFRKQHLVTFEALFVQVVAIAREAGRAGRGADSGRSKVKASTSTQSRRNA